MIYETPFKKSNITITGDPEGEKREKRLEILKI